MYHIGFVYINPLNGYRELNSYKELCFTLLATITSLARELIPTGVGEHIYFHPQTAGLCSEPVTSLWESGWRMRITFGE